MKLLRTIRDVIENPILNDGWFYLRNELCGLESLGFFRLEDIDDAPEDTNQETADLRAEGWYSTISSDDIDEVIENTAQQIDNATTDQLFKACQFFFERDAFICW